MCRNLITGIVLSLLLSACGKEDVDSDLRTQQNSAGRFQTSMNERNSDLQNDTMSAMETIETVNRDLLMQRLDELYSEIESEENRLLLMQRNNSSDIGKEVKLIESLKTQVGEIEKEVK